jgi:hypothetical protein
MDPAIAVRLALDTPIGCLDCIQRLGGTRDGLAERFSARIQRVQRNVSLFIGAMKLRESGVANKQLSALPKWN